MPVSRKFGVELEFLIVSCYFNSAQLGKSGWFSLIYVGRIAVTALCVVAKIRPHLTNKGVSFILQRLGCRAKWIDDIITSHNCLQYVFINILCSFKLAQS